MQTIKIYSTEAEANAECFRESRGYTQWFCPMINRNCVGLGGLDAGVMIKPCLCYQKSMVFQILDWEGVPKPAWKVMPAKCTNVSLVGEEQ